MRYDTTRGDAWRGDANKGEVKRIKAMRSEIIAPKTELPSSCRGTPFSTSG